MTRIIILILVFAGFVSAGTDSENIAPDLMEEIRQLYYQGVEDESYIAELAGVIRAEFGADTSSYSPEIIAYLGGVEALKSKHAFWPFSKLGYLNKSMEIFARAVSRAPESLEIRFMRFSVLHFVPDFLGFNEEKREDVKILVRLLAEGEGADYTELHRGIVNFMLESGRLNEEEYTVLASDLKMAKIDE